MKILIAAVALTIASPAFAQTADPHAGHHEGQHEGHSEGKHDQHEQHKDCCEGKDGARMECCEKAEDGKKMACCDKHEAKADAHAGHDMSKH